MSLMSTNDLYKCKSVCVFFRWWRIYCCSEPVESSYKTFTVKLGNLPDSTGNDKVKLTGDMITTKLNL